MTFLSRKSQGPASYLSTWKLRQEHLKNKDKKQSRPWKATGVCQSLSLKVLLENKDEFIISFHGEEGNENYKLCSLSEYPEPEQKASVHVRRNE